MIPQYSLYFTRSNIITDVSTHKIDKEEEEGEKEEEANGTGIGTRMKHIKLQTRKFPNCACVDFDEKYFSNIFSVGSKHAACVLVSNRLFNESPFSRFFP